MNPATETAHAALSIPGAFSLSVVGFAIVFFVLIVLMIVIKVLRAALAQLDASRAAAAAVAAPVAAAASPAPASNPNMVPAKGSLGEIKLHNVDDRTAALVMAIVADEMKAPLNELRFLSIREKK